MAIVEIDTPEGKRYFRVNKCGEEVNQVFIDTLGIAPEEAHPLLVKAALKFNQHATGHEGFSSVNAARVKIISEH